MFKTDDIVICVRPRVDALDYRDAVARVESASSEFIRIAEWLPGPRHFKQMYADQFELDGAYQAALAKKEAATSADYYAAITE